MAQAMFHTKGVINKQSKSLENERQRATTLNPLLTTTNELPPQTKQRSSSFSKAVHQLFGFVQRKLSHTDDEDAHQLTDIRHKD